MRRAPLLLLVSCAGLLLGGTGSALATTVTLGADTLTITGGDNADHDIQFRANGANDDIIDTAGFPTIPGDCTYVSDTTWISCVSGSRFNVQVDLGAGNDKVTFGGSQFDCFNGYTLNLGDGSNSTDLYAGCPTSPVEMATITSGSGPDTLTGGNQSAITFNAGGGDDNVYGGTGDDIVHGGDGNDRLFGHAGNDQVLGEGGNDAVNGNEGNDRVDGGDGDDGLELCQSCFGSGNDTGVGADTYVGGAGNDKLWLDGHAGGMNISLDGQANDGLPGEGDNVGSDIEVINGTTGNDVFTGSAGADEFDGDSGNDEIHGAGGDDDLYGGGGDDKLFGDGGADKVQGGPGADTVDGGAGTDNLYGDIAGCSVFCSFDSDTLLARDGEKDAVDCGEGADTATVDFVDVVAGCASVDRAPEDAPPPTCGRAAIRCVAAPGALTFGVSLVGKARRATGLGLKVTCSAACSFKLALILSKKTAKRFGLGSKAVAIGTAKGALLTAGKKSAKLKLSAKARRKLKGAKGVAATLRLTVTDAAGKSASRSRRLTLLR